MSPPKKLGRGGASGPAGEAGVGCVTEREGLEGVVG
jgi:hypothetical protein